MSAPWSEGHVYSLKLGKSFRQRSGSSFHTLQFPFKPASLEGGAKGSIEMSGEKVSLEVTPTTGGTALQFKGTWHEAKEGECVLIWEEGVFRLEKLSSTAKALRQSTATRGTSAKRQRTPGQRTPTAGRAKVQENPEDAAGEDLENFAAELEEEMLAAD